MAITDSGRPLTVESALAHPVLRSAVLLAGGSGLTRQVDGVSVLDVANVEETLPDHLVFSSVYPLSDLDLGRLVKDLSRIGASALGLKAHGFWTKPPAELIAAADRYRLPVLSLPEGRFADLMTPLLEEIAERQAERLRRASGLHNSLTEASLRQEGLPAVVRLLGQALGLETAILDEDGEILAATGEDRQWQSAELIELATTSAESVERELPEGMRYLAPIVIGRRRHGTLVVADPPPRDPFVRSAVSLATVVSGIELLHQQKVEAVHRKYQRELLDDLAEGRLGEKESEERARRIGWPLRRPYVVMVMVRRPESPRRFDALEPVPLTDEELLTLSRAVVNTRAEARPFWRAPGLGVVVHLHEGEDSAKVAAELFGLLCRTRRLPWAAEELVAGLSRPAHDVTGLVGSFREAALSVLLSSRIRRGELRVEPFDDMGVVRTLALADDREALAQIAGDVLGPIMDGSRSSGELLETLSVLLAANMRLTQAATELYFHYNTIRHRLARLRELFPTDLESAEGRLKLWLAVTALRIADVDRHLPGYGRL